MGVTESFRGEPGTAGVVPAGRGGLLDVLNVAAVLLDAEGRIDLWSPQAEILFGYSAEEALGQYAAQLLIDKEHLDTVLALFARVMDDGESWAGVVPVRNKDGSTRRVEFRNMRLQDDQREYWALGLATDQATLQQVERHLALSAQLVSQSPIGLGMLDTDLRYVSVNPAEERMNGVSAAEHVGRHVHEVLPHLDPSFEAVMREVLATGVPMLDQYTVGRTAADPDNDHAWSISFYRLETPSGEVLGVATSSVDVTDRHRAVEEQRHTALTLQRSLLPHPPPQRPGLDIAFRYRPAQATMEIGGDWFDVIPLSGDKTALVVGDVMGSGVGAAATMGQLRTATRTLADLDLAPAQVLYHLDHITDGLETIATCVYAVFDPRALLCGSPSPGICRRSFSTRTAHADCSTCPPEHPWAAAASLSTPPPSPSRRATSSSCTPTVWWRPATSRSTNAWALFSTSSTTRAARWTRPATCFCTPCVRWATATT